MENEKPKLKKKFIGKYILIGITRLDCEGNIIRQDQYHGIFEAMDDQGIRIRLKDSDEIFTLPFP
ncbi:MAG: hypothetical protein ACFFC7_00155 [Candidatus Hermodarchaeota archaeon]